VELTPELLERLRRSGISVDREGELIHEGEPVRHEGLRRALFRWLDRLDDGRYILRLDERRFAYLEVADTPLVVRALRLDGRTGDVQLQLSDGAEELLDPRTLTVDEQGILRCGVRGGRLEARLSTSAAAVLAERLTETPQGPALTSPQGPPRPLARRRGSPP
jgi:Protein of unknown function (DUF1285)